MAKDLPVTLIGLDLGTSKTAVIIAGVYKGSLELVGAGETPSVGIQKGVITNPALAAKSVKQALEKAEKVAGVRGGKVSVSYCGAGIEVENYQTGCIATTGCDPLPDGVLPGKRMILRFPAPFTQTGCDPADSGSRAVTAPSEDIASLNECVRLAGPTVQEVIYGPLAGAHALLTPAEMEFGTILMDIGAGTTSISIFDRGLLRETTVLPLGGEHLAGDLAIGLRISLAEAGDILKEYKPEAAPGEIADCAGTGIGAGVISVKPKDLVQSIVEARITEIISLAGKVIRGFHYPGFLPGGVVFCGGVSQLSGLAPVAGEILQMPVRIGQFQTVGLTLSPAYTNALGLVKYQFSRLRGERKNFKVRQDQNEGFVDRVINWFQDRKKGDRRY